MFQSPILPTSASREPTKSLCCARSFVETSGYYSQKFRSSGKRLVSLRSAFGDS